MKIWHIYINNRSRAFANPNSIREYFILFIRGWKPFNNKWWSKPSNNLKIALKNNEAIC